MWLTHGDPAFLHDNADHTDGAVERFAYPELAAFEEGGNKEEDEWWYEQDQLES